MPSVSLIDIQRERGLTLSIVGGFVVDAGILWVQYHVAIAYGVLLLLEISLLPETFYPRKSISDSVILDQGLDNVRRTKNLKLWVSFLAPLLFHYSHESSGSTAASSGIKEAHVCDGHRLHETCGTASIRVCNHSVHILPVLVVRVQCPK